MLQTRAASSACTMLFAIFSNPVAQFLARFCVQCKCLYCILICFKSPVSVFVCSGPNGVWTLEKKGLKPNINISFNEAIPTRTHMALKKLLETGHIKYIISQNIDGLHLRSGVPREHISELHGNMFTEQCKSCNR